MLERECYNEDLSMAARVCGGFSLFGEWLSLVEHLVRDQGVGGSNPLSPTILSLGFSIVYAAFVAWVFSAVFGTFGTTEGNSNPNPHRSAHFLRNAIGLWYAKIPSESCRCFFEAVFVM